MGHLSESLGHNTPSGEERPFQYAHPETQHNRRAGDSLANTATDQDSPDAVAALFSETVLAIQKSLKEIAKNHCRMVEANVQRAHAAARHAEVMDHITRDRSIS